jgi:hypothetical protein
LQCIALVLIFFFFVIAAECASAKDPALCSELLNLGSRDAQVRLDRLASWRSAAAQAEMQAIDAENLACVEEVVRERGWPGDSLVGVRASAAAWTIIEHASGDVQKRYLDLMAEAADAGELSWSLLATTIDRVLVREGKPQRFGTQFVLRGRTWEPEPIEDAAHVDERRARAGLRPLAEYTRTMQSAYGAR